ncbi:hypothetical protein PoB_003036200 [Plakobranchus ocellatus]|uniref:Uncharacterized protein n=1 Tax=Plakobranchus ocellatus TaxID=259542 RepID=A0AAV4AA48_9GAST|nr:hypothetical protein PoB_003036200 [Plakobranchus ocellatus]
MKIKYESRKFLELSRARVPPPALRRDGGPESLRSLCSGLARLKNNSPTSSRPRHLNPWCAVAGHRDQYKKPKLEKGYILQRKKCVLFLWVLGVSIARKHTCRDLQSILFRSAYC